MSAGILTTVSKDMVDVSEKEAEIRGNAQWVCFRSINESQRWGGSAIDTTNTVSYEHNNTLTDSINTVLIRQRDVHATDTTRSHTQ